MIEAATIQSPCEDTPLPLLPPTYFAPAGRDSCDEFRRKAAVVQDVPLLRRTLHATPSMIMILNAQRQIVAANKSLLATVGTTIDNLSEKRPGEAIGCVWAKHGPDGCGTSQYCVTCGAVNAILESQRTGEEVVRECRILIDTSGGVVPMDLKVTTASLQIGEDTFILAAIEDITESKRLWELVSQVAADFGEFSTQVEGANEELHSAKASEPEDVILTVVKLVAANQHMLQQLTSAETKLQEQAKELETKAIEGRIDALTGLANRRAFDHEFASRHAECRRRGSTFSLAMVDVDHFKGLNDTHGHQAGDAVLRGLAGVLLKQAREMDVVARYGGEEFAIIFPQTSAAESVVAAERIRQAVAKESIRFGQAALRLTVSIGVAELRKGETAEGLVQRADTALYAAKSAGRNRTCWHDGQSGHVVGSGKGPPVHRDSQLGPSTESDLQQAMAVL